MGHNRLAGSTSPYLLQHADNPVHWWPWGDAAFAAAKAEDKPIFLSIGYAACHWCHVMAHESFENEHIAAQLNDDFISIKLDREERPDIDALYQAALTGLGQHGGWPLTMILTPDGEPFWGGTYFPPTDEGQGTGLDSVLSRLVDAYKTQPADVQKNAAALKAHVSQSTQQRASGNMELGYLDLAAERFLSQMDLQHGGITGAPKFPNTTVFNHLWRTYQRSEDAQYAASVQLTYTMMCQGGLFDHLGGGFARYSTDGRWLVPHFEKMLCDNALILKDLCTLHGYVPQALYAQRIAQNVDWFLRDMRLENGALASAMDADSEGEEGKFYVWDRAEIFAHLGQERAAYFCSIYDITEKGNFEGRNIPNRLDHLELGSMEDEARLVAACEKLRLVRNARPAPARDDKVLTDWNALSIIAITHAAKLLQRPDWLAAAKDIYKAVINLNFQTDRMMHASRNGEVGGASLLEDYAALGLAGLALSCAEDDPGYLEFIQYLADEMLMHFSAESGAFHQSRVEDAPGLGRPIPIHDQPIPSGNALAISFLAKLGQLLGAERYSDAALRAVNALGGEMQKNFMGLGAYMAAFEDLVDPLEVSWAPGDFDSETIAWALTPPGGLILGPGLRKVHDGPITSAFKSGLMICRQRSCGLPLTDRETAINALRTARRVEEEK